MEITNEVDKNFGPEITVRKYSLPDLRINPSVREGNWLQLKLKFIKYKIKEFLSLNISVLNVEYSYRRFEEDFERLINSDTNQIFDSLDTLKTLELEELLKKYKYYQDYRNFQPVFNNFIIKNKNIGLEMNFLVYKLQVIAKNERGEPIKKELKNMITPSSGKLELISEVKMWFVDYFTKFFGRFFNIASVEFALTDKTSFGIPLRNTELLMTVKFVSSEETFICSKFYTRAIASEIDDIRKYENTDLTVYDVDDKYKLIFDRNENQQQTISDGGLATDKLYLISPGCKEHYPFATKKFEMKHGEIADNILKITQKTRAYIPRMKNTVFGDSFSEEDLVKNVTQPKPTYSASIWNEFRAKIEVEVRKDESNKMSILDAYRQRLKEKNKEYNDERKKTFNERKKTFAERNFRRDGRSYHDNRSYHERRSNSNSGRSGRSGSRSNDNYRQRSETEQRPRNYPPRSDRQYNNSDRQYNNSDRQYNNSDRGSFGPKSDSNSGSDRRTYSSDRRTYNSDRRSTSGSNYSDRLSMNNSIDSASQRSINALKQKALNKITPTGGRYEVLGEQTDEPVNKQPQPEQKQQRFSNRSSVNIPMNIRDCTNEDVSDFMLYKGRKYRKNGRKQQAVNLTHFKRIIPKNQGRSQTPNSSIASPRSSLPSPESHFGIFVTRQSQIKEPAYTKQEIPKTKEQETPKSKETPTVSYKDLDDLDEY